LPTNLGVITEADYLTHIFERRLEAKKKAFETEMITKLKKGQRKSKAAARLLSISKDIYSQRFRKRLV
jgi:hypothetical protein